MSDLATAFLELARRGPDRTAITVRGAGGEFATTSRADLARAVARAADECRLRPAREALLPFDGPRTAGAAVHLLATLAAGRGFSFLDPRLPSAARETLRSRAAAAPGRVGERAIGACLFTSGSTGEPKGVLIPRDDLFARAEAEVRWFGLDEEDVLLGVLPLSFDVGLNQLMAGLLAGAEVVLLDSYMPGDILDAAEARGVTGFSAVPTIWRQMLLRDARFDRGRAHRALRYVTVSGGDLAAAELARLPGLTDGAGIFKTFGQTEAFRSASLRPEEFRARPTSVGRAFPGARFRIAGPDGEIRGPGEEGEVLHSGLGVFAGYLEEEGAPGKLVRDPTSGADSGPAVRTGDTGWVDEDGYLYLRGRSDRMVKIGGTRVYPREVAARVLAIPDVAEAEVVVAGERGGELGLAAFLVPAGAERPGPAELRRRLADVLPAFLLPSILTWLDTIPTLPNGKTDLRALEEMATNS